MSALIRRPLRRLRANSAYVLVMVLVAVALVYLLIQPGHWRRGVAIIASAVLLAGVFRLVLPEPAAGMLVVRRRWLDVATYLVLGGLILLIDIRLTS